MDLRRDKNNKPSAIMENSEYPSSDRLISQLSQLRSNLKAAYETLDSIAPDTDPDVAMKVADMVDVINGLHECEFELMDMLAKDGLFSSPIPSRCEGVIGSGSGDNDVHSASQEDLSLYGAYAVSSSRPMRANDLTKSDKSSDQDRVDSIGISQIPPFHRLDYIKRLEEIQKMNERLVDRCRSLGLVLSRGFAIDKNISTKMKEVKDIVATKQQAEKKILELKALMQQVTDEKLDTEISLSKIENDESYGRPYRFESRLASRGATPLSPADAHSARAPEEGNVIRKPRSFLEAVDSSETNTAPDYSQFLRGLRQPFSRDNGERESAFVPIHNASQLDPTRDKNKCSSNMDHHGDANNEVKAPRAANASLLRRVIEGGNQNHYSQNISQVDPHRQGRSSSARASIVPPQPVGCNTIPSNLFRSNYSKSPPSMQSSSGIGSMNSRSMASLDNGRNDLPPYLPCNMSRLASRGHDTEDNLGQRSFPERANMSSNNLNKSYRQPTRSSSFYSELDFRNHDIFPTGWDEDPLHAHSPLRSRSPEFRRRFLSTMESQQITDELNRMLRCRTRNSEESLPLAHQNWWSSSTELGQMDRHPFDHQNFVQRGKSMLGERSAADCYTQIMQLHVGVQEITQQIRNLTASVNGNKTATRDALLQHRFDMHSVTRCIRDVSDMISENMKRVEGQLSNQNRLIMDLETRLRRIEESQRAGSLKYESTRDREWQVPGRPDFMVSQDLSFQYGHGSRDAISRERETGQSGSMLNNQIPPGTRANNYWDNFRSYSRQNMLSKSNANVPQQFSHEASPSATESIRQVSSDTLNNSQPPVSDLSAESSRRNGNGKNLWATSGFYENMSTNAKKRNKDQKSQSSTITSLAKSTGNGNISLANCSSTAEPLRTDSQPPEPDESNTLPLNRERTFSQMSPPSYPPPYLRDLDSGPFSRLPAFEVPLPISHNASSPDSVRRKFTESENNHRVSPGTIDAEIQQLRSGGHHENQELIDTGDDSDTPGWVLNALEAVNSTSDFHSPVMSPLLRAVTDNNENNALDLSESQESGAGRISPLNLESPTATVSMNIRCEESAAPWESGSRSSESTSNNNI